MYAYILDMFLENPPRTQTRILKDSKSISGHLKHESSKNPFVILYFRDAESRPNQNPKPKPQGQQKHQRPFET
jgi:hypothetical protein